MDQGQLISYITCHNCGIQKSSCVRIFFSNCKHLFCKSCLQQIGGKCSTCNAPARFLEVGPSMPPDVLDYFIPNQSSSQSGPCNKALFQLAQQNIFLSQRKELPGKYEAMKKSVRQEMNQLNALKKRVQEEQNLIRRLEVAITEKKMKKGRGATRSFSPSNSLNRSLGSLSASTGDITRSSGYGTKSNESFFGPNTSGQEMTPVRTTSPSWPQNPSNQINTASGFNALQRPQHQAIVNQQPQYQFPKPKFTSNTEKRELQHMAARQQFAANQKLPFARGNFLSTAVGKRTFDQSYDSDVSKTKPPPQGTNANFSSFAFNKRRY